MLVQARDTGRVLLVQRTPTKHDPDEAYARWEIPAGHLDPGETPWEAAVREWQEETGATLAGDAEAGWVDGDYEGFVVRVESEDAIDLSPDGAEVSDARWWAPSDLDDERIREKVTETLGLIQPLLKASWSDFHRHTDEIIEHFAPTVRAAMRQVHEADTIRQAIRAAYTAKKATRTTPLARTRPTPTAAAALGVGGLGAAVGAGGVAAGGGVGAAAAILVTAQLDLAAIEAVLTAIYANAYYQGAHEAQQASGGTLPPTVGEVPDGYWTDWQPGVASEPPDLMAEARTVIAGITQTQTDRIVAAIEHGVRTGRPMATVETEVAGIIDTAARAWLITETEYARAMTRGARDTYRLNNVPYVEWLHQPDACPRCMENAEVSPIPVTDSWPQGNVPVHPRCRCAEAPYIP